jgi:hypothetical protein
MYPSIKYNLIEKAVRFYAEGVSEHDATLIEGCLEMIRFGMSTTLLTFGNRYYMYDGDLPIEERGLTIGGYESAWLADLAMSYILETVDKKTFENMELFEIYRDDGFGIFKGSKSKNDINDWLQDFQTTVNEQAGSDALIFTAEVWLPGQGDAGETVGKTSVTTNETFPFLDMDMSWDKKTGKLVFGVHLKPNQQLKYLNEGSSHTPGCFKAISSGVCHRLAKLTTMDTDNGDKKLDELYPKHFEALSSAGLLEGKRIPTLREKKTELENSKENKRINDVLKKRQANDRKRTIFFKICFSDYWRKPIHKTISDIKANFPTLKWLRVSMAYHRSLNVRDLFQGDLNSKITKGVKSLDFENLDCNCRNKQGCPFLGKCRNSIVVYQATCQATGKKYIGNTQQHVKTRLSQHVQDTKKLFIDGKRSDSFANHFAKIVPAGTEKKEVKNFVKVKVDILWQGDPISCMKLFGTRSCKLCAKEKILILNLTRKQPQMAINKCTEVYGACRHRPRFHRFDQSQTNATSTDESDKDERVTRPSSTTSMESNSSTISNESFFERRESTLLQPDHNCGFDVNRKNGLKARFLIGLDRGNINPDSVVSNLDEFPTGEGQDLPLAEELPETF